MNKIRIISTGNDVEEGKRFFVLYAPTVADITDEELTKTIPNYKELLLGGSVIFTDDLSVKVWNEADEEFK